MNINDVVLGIRRSRGDKIIRLYGEAPLGQDGSAEFDSVQFRSLVTDAVSRVDGICSDGDHFPAEVLVPRHGFQILHHVRQSNPKTVKNLLNPNRLPRTWKSSKVHFAIGTEVQQEGTPKSAGRSGFRRVTVVSVCLNETTTSVTDVDEVSFLNVSPDNLNASVFSVLLSEYLRSCFPYTIWSRDGYQWRRFLDTVAVEFGKKSDLDPDPLLLNYGVPIDQAVGIDSVWAKAAESLFSEGSVSDCSDASLAKAVAKSWRRYGGPLKENALERLLSQSTNKMFAGRPSIQDPGKSLRSVLLSGDAEIVMTLTRPNARRQKQIVSLLQLKNWGKHKVGFIQNCDLTDCHGFFDEQSLVKFDARCLRLAFSMSGNGE